MKHFKRQPTPPADTKPAATDIPGVDFGWKVHAAIQDWTKAVDTKASIVLVATSGVGLFAGNQVFSTEGSLHATSGGQLWAVRVMGAAFLLGGLFALSVVLPSLKRRRNKAIADQGLVFFGHLRHRSVQDIEAALLDLSQQEVIGQLASQMQVTSKIAWRKHVRLQAALLLLLLVIAVGAFVTAQTAF